MSKGDLFLISYSAYGDSKCENNSLKTALREEREEHVIWTWESQCCKNSSTGGIPEEEKTGEVKSSCFLPCSFLQGTKVVYWSTLSCNQDDKTFSMLRKTLGSFLGNASDEDFPPDEWKILLVVSLLYKSSFRFSFFTSTDA